MVCSLRRNETQTDQQEQTVDKITPETVQKIGSSSVSPLEIFQWQLSLVDTRGLNHNIPEAPAVLEAIGPGADFVTTHRMRLQELDEVMAGHEPAGSLKIQMVL